MMKVNNINNTGFGARIQIAKLQKYTYLANELQRTAPPASQASTGANYLSSCVSTIAGVSAGKTTAAGSGAIGTAFSAKAFGTDMSGIVPSVIAKITPSAAPETVATSIEHPEIAGSIFSTVGEWFNRHFRFNFDNKQIRKFPN